MGDGETCGGGRGSYARHYFEYGEPGSMADKAGGMSVLEARRKDAEEEQRNSKLVDIFSFSESSTAKYGCDNIMLPLKQVIEKFGKTALYPSSNDENEFTTDGKGTPASVDWRLAREITLREGRLVRVRLWSTE